jgi:hypothetical protein
MLLTTLRPELPRRGDKNVRQAVGTSWLVRHRSMVFHLHASGMDNSLGGVAVQRSSRRTRPIGLQARGRNAGEDLRNRTEGGGNRGPKRRYAVNFFPRPRSSDRPAAAGGMRTGWPLPLGYDVRDKKLVINPREAHRVRIIFRRLAQISRVAADHRPGSDGSP